MEKRSTFLKVRQVAERLSVAMSTVYALCAQGRLPCQRFGIGRGSIRISEQDLLAYLEASKVRAKPAAPVSRRGLKHITMPVA